MKRAIAIVLTLVIALTLFGCAKKPEAEQTIAPASSGTDAAAPAGPTLPESIPAEWEYEVTTETESQEKENDENVLLATWSYERPVLGCKAGTGQSEDPSMSGAPEEMEKVCKAFNDRVDALVSDSRADFAGMCEEAQELYEGREPEYRADFNAFCSDVTVEKVYRNGDLLEVLLTDYGYWGGAHGGMLYVNLHFDLKTGEFFDLDDLTDRPDELLRGLKHNLLEKIWAQEESQWYYDDFDEIVLAKEGFNVSFGEDGMTVSFEQYEIAPYVMGILEYTIPYAEFTRFLNERGERLLDISAEEKALGDFYEAEEMWYWFDGVMPINWDDARYVHVESNGESWDAQYGRVDVPGVTSLAELRELLCKRFSEELIDERIEAFTGGDNPLLREIDGTLYVQPAGHGDDMYIDSVDYRVELKADGSGGNVIATIQWRDYDEEKEEWVLTETSEVMFPFEQTESGARFTEFHSIW